MSQTGDIRPARRNIVMRYLSRFDEGEAVRWAFRGLLLGAIGVVALDVNEMRELWSDQASAASPTLSAPVLPPAVRSGKPGTETVDPRGNVTADEGLLRSPLAFTLEPGGVLRAQGYIDPGAWTRFEDEMTARGEYVRTVSFNSPGGSLDDAIGIASTIRGRGLVTEVPDGAICASSCPLALAGGVERRIGGKAAIGVHQFYSVAAEPTDPAQAMADAQATTARIARHLSEMGVDPILWLHALDTPPRSLYYLSAEEIARYRLSTGTAEIAAAQ